MNQRINSRTRFIVKRIIFLLILGLLFLIILNTTTTHAAPTQKAGQQEQVDDAVLDDVQENVEASGRYQFSAQIEQILIPRAVAANIGQSEERVDTYMTGDVTLPDSATISLQFEGGTNIPPLTLEQVDGKVYLLRDGERQEIENPIGGVAPTGEFLSYLKAADNIQLKPNTDHPNLTIYTFEVDGDEYAKYVRDVAQSQLPPDQQDTQIALSPALRNMTGTGELWVDVDGYPRRQILDLYIPGMNDLYDSQTHYVVDYVIEEPLVGVPSLAANSLLANPESSASVAVETETAVSPPQTISSETLLTLAMKSVATILLIVIVSIFSLMLARGHRSLRVVVPIFIVVSMVATPFLRQNAYASAENEEGETAVSLSEALGVSSQTEASNAPSNIAQQTTNESCGTGDTTTDSDLDGTTDFVERCLGTDLYYYDSDYDGITDTLEIDGFDYNSQTWYLDPKNVDTNRDGIADVNEMPAAYGGFAPALDSNSDGVPNVWDDDNDGDGVLDLHDLDPFSATGYDDSFSFSTTLEQSSFDGYQYIDFQVQPENADHLRYTTTALDWPFDDEGTIQDLDNSDEDIHLSPYLKATTIGRPSKELIEEYGITYSFLGYVGSGWQPVEKQRFELFIPLDPLSDGGKITAFQGKIVFEPGSFDTVAWENLELVWLVTADHDQQVGNEVNIETKLVAEYSESFRITGLEITKSGGVDYALFGTPNNSADNRDMFQLLHGLEVSFLSTTTFDVDELVSRFGNDTTPITNTWGVPATDIAILTPAVGEEPEHFDEVITATANDINIFLDSNSYPQDAMVTVGLAMQTELGKTGLDDLTNVDTSTDIRFNLATVPMSTDRSLNIYNMTHEDGSWDQVINDELWAAMQDRYTDLSVILAELQLTYPDLTEADLFGAIYGFTLAWSTGGVTSIQIDGTSLVPEAADDVLIYERYDVDSITDSISYLIETNELAIEGSGLVTTTSYGYYNYIRDNTFVDTDFYFGSVPIFDKEIIFGGTISAGVFRGFKAGGLVVNALFKLSTLNNSSKFLTAQPQLSAYKSWSTWLGSYSKTGKVGMLARNAVAISKALVIIGIVVSIALFGYEIYTIWSNYASFSSPYGYEQGYALAYAITATVVATIMLVLAFTGVGIFILLVFAIVGLVIWLIGWAFGEDIDLTAVFIHAVITAVWLVDPYTKLVDFDFDGLETSAPDGLVQGATLTFSDEFMGVIWRQEGNNLDQLRRGKTYGYFTARADSNVNVSVGRKTERCSSSERWYITGGYGYAPNQICENDLSVAYTFTSPGRNTNVYLKHNVIAETRYEECYLFGSICNDETDHMNLPGELESKDQWDEIELTFDILPESVEALWNWDEISNPDADGDDILNRNDMESATTDTDSDGIMNRYDWDSDDDGLSDGFEKNTNTDTGADALLQDTDGDGLTDGQEHQLGTIINDADSDDDGLLDGEEVFHWNGSAWTGGGWFIDINGTDYWVFTDPFMVDADMDGLSDGTEEAAASSPNAPNEAPVLTLTATPYLIGPSGETAVFAANSTAVTASANLLNLAGSAITETLTFCAPSSLTNVSITTSGDSTPTETVNSNCVAYDFSSDPLLFFQAFSIELTANASSSTSSSSFDVSLPHNIDGTVADIVATVPYEEDNTIPTVELTEPYTGTILIGDYFVMGGFSADGHSWIDHIDVTVPAGTFTAEATSPWAYTWDLPDEGLVTVSAIAYDAVGNASASQSVQVIVDSLAPVITSDLAPNTTISAGESYSDTIELSGTVTDNYSGVRRVQMRYNEQPWRTIWSTESDELLNTTWNGTWELPFITEKAQGEHTLHLRAYDVYGNIGYLEQTIFIDIVPPSNELTSRTFSQETPPHVPLNEEITLYGVANDAGHNPLPAAPADLSGNLHSISDATVWLQPDNYQSDDAGITVAWLGDFNGDRLGDLAIGLPAEAGGAGKVSIVQGSAGDWAIPNIGELDFLSAHKPSFIGVDGAGLGTAVSSAGDFDGNGFQELLIGDPVNNRIFMVYGAGFEFGANQVLDSSRAGKWSEIISTDEDNPETITTQFAAAGDVNNDTLGDILVSTTSASSGNVYLLVGNSSPYETQFVNEMAGAVFATSTSGASVAGVGDLNGDFIDDFAIATSGTVYLFAGGTNWAEFGLSTLTTAQAMGTFATSDLLPTLVGAGDLNGDGIDDFAYSNGTTPVAVFGNAGAAFSTQTMSGNGFLATAGDVDKDGLGDLLIGNDDDANLYLGGSLGSVAATIEGVASSASAPYIAGADLAGDGSSDLLLVPSETAASDLGYATGVQQVRAPFIPQSALPTSNGTTGNASSATMVAPLGIRAPEAPGDATVGIAGADFTSIQAAIDSGATRVLIQPGTYQEAITVTDNVVIAGSGSGLTYLTFPAVTSDTVLINVDGASDSSVMNMTLVGDGTQTGLSVTNDASNIDLSRTIIRGMETAVFIDGSTTNLDLKNNSFIDNDNGLNATSCASVDVRNTIFAYNTGTALHYEVCAAIQRHEYNLYWANGTDMLPNDPGGGELFSDPLFLDVGNGDLRTELYSPVIDAGAPGDAVPPGAGDFADIGHMEQTGASFVADQTYCSTCANNGLIWEVDAFATIQEAVDAAEADMATLYNGTGSQFAVGVGEGVYTESVEISFNLRLLGSNPNLTTIQGVNAPAVTLTATVGTEVSGFTLIGGGVSPVGVAVTGGTSQVLIAYNLIKENETGILVNGRSSGAAKSNSIISNTTGIHTTGNYNWEYNWLDTSSNIISNNTNGMIAENRAVVFTDYNLLYNTVNYTEITTGPGIVTTTNIITGIHDILDQDPLLTGEFGYLQLGSPAIDSAALDTPVPTGGGSGADIGWHELLNAPISLFMGQADDSVATESIGVGQVEYGIVAVAVVTSPVTSTLPMTWTIATLDSPGEKLTYWSAGYTPTATGFYRIYGRATDTLGNMETDSDDWYEGSFYVDDTAPVVSVEVVRNVSVQNSWLRLTGVVTDYVGTSFDVEDIYFTVDGERYDGLWTIEQWEADGITGRKFHGNYMNDVDATHVVDVQAFAVDGAGHVGSSSVVQETVDDSFTNYYYDATPPRFTVDLVVRDTVTTTEDLVWGIYLESVGVEGQATDYRTGAGEGFTRINGYEISFDGGLTWAVMESSLGYFGVLNGRFSYEWQIPDGYDATSFPAKIRVTDYGGLSSMTSFTISVDTGSPRLVGDINVDATAAEGMHLDDYEYATFTWHTPTDGNGVMEEVVIGGQTGGVGVPWYPSDGNSSWSDQIDGPGDWYAHVGAEDQWGNIDYTVFGPWHVGQVRGFELPWNSGAVQSHIIDGYLDISHDEWLTATEWLDDDQRSEQTQSLYSTWDGGATFVGWQGANWDTDGGMWVYWDLAAGGTTAQVTGTIRLPFDADYAAYVIASTTVEGWYYNGANWVASQAGPNMQQDTGSGGTELKFWFNELGNGTGNYSHHRMFAYGLDYAGDVWATFPTINPLADDFEYYYEWTAADGFGLLDLPTASQQPYVDMLVTSDPAVQDTLTNGSIVNYILALTNLEDANSSNVQLVITGTVGLNYQSVAGATCTDCASNVEWTMDIPAIVPGATHLVTVTAQLDSDMSGIDQVISTLQLKTEIPLLQREAVVHQVDLAPPIVTILTNPGNVVPVGTQRVIGNATDESGTGVELVEVSLDGTSWIPADGTLAWASDMGSAEPTGSWQVYARATDYHGNVGDVEIKTFVIDETAPLITATVPALVGNAQVTLLDGIAQDLAPTGAIVQNVDAQLDSDTAVWSDAGLDGGIGNDQQHWVYPWLLPHEDGVTHQIRFRATDYGDNSTVSAWYPVIVDTVAPAITVTRHLVQVMVGSSTIALAGTANDGHSVDRIWVTIYADDGTASEVELTPSGNEWSFAPDLALGSYTLVVEASDEIGNVRSVGTFALAVVSVLDQFALTITMDGAGSGIVSSLPAGIDCGDSCNAIYDYGTVVTLTAVADTGSAFMGWSGACSGTDACVVTMDTAQNVTATFDTAQFYIFLPVIIKE